MFLLLFAWPNYASNKNLLINSEENVEPSIFNKEFDREWSPPFEKVEIRCTCIEFTDEHLKKNIFKQLITLTKSCKFLGYVL